MHGGASRPLAALDLSLPFLGAIEAYLRQGLDRRLRQSPLAHKRKQRFFEDRISPGG